MPDFATFRCSGEAELVSLAEQLNDSAQSLLNRANETYLSLLRDIDVQSQAREDLVEKALEAVRDLKAINNVERRKLRYQDKACFAAALGCSRFFLLEAQLLNLAATRQMELQFARRMSAFDEKRGDLLLDAANENITTRSNDAQQFSSELLLRQEQLRRCQG